VGSYCQPQPVSDRLRRIGRRGASWVTVVMPWRCSGPRSPWSWPTRTWRQSGRLGLARSAALCGMFLC